MIGVGLIGCGHVAEHKHLPALASSSRGRVVALADLDPARMERLAERHRIGGRHTDAASLLADPAVEVAGVLTPAPTHAEIVAAALAAGRPVLVERPLAPTLDGARRILDLAAGAAPAAGVSFNLRAHRLVETARAMIDAGSIGPVSALQSLVRGPASAGGGALFEKGCDHYDLWRLLAGAEADEVSAVGRADQVAVSVRMRGGALATGLFADCRGTVNRITVHGPGGHLDVSLLEHDGLRFVPASRYPGDLRTRLRRLGSTLRRAPESVRPILGGGDYRLSYARQWDSALASLDRGAAPGAALEDGLRAVEIAVAAERSCELGRAVAISELRDDARPERDRSAISSR